MQGFTLSVLSSTKEVIRIFKIACRGASATKDKSKAFFNYYRDATAAKEKNIKLLKTKTCCRDAKRSRTRTSSYLELKVVVATPRGEEREHQATSS